MTAAGSPSPRRPPPSEFAASPPRTPLTSSTSARQASSRLPPVAAGTNDAAQEEYWNARSVYVAPHPPSGSHCVLQNDLLCSFGGLQSECEGMLFHVVTKDEALQPSNRFVYLRACHQHSAAPIAELLNQLSTTPGRYLMTSLEAAGVPMTEVVLDTVFPVLAHNAPVLTSLNFRLCGLHDRLWTKLSEFLCATPFPRVTTLELSCNALQDNDAPSLRRVMESLPRLSRIGLLRNRLSKVVSRSLVALLQDRSRSGSAVPTADQRVCPHYATPTRGSIQRSPSRERSPSESVAQSASPTRPGTSSSSTAMVARRLVGTSGTWDDSSSGTVLSPPRTARTSSSRRVTSPVSSDAHENKSLYTILPIPKALRPGVDEIRVPKIARPDFVRCVEMYRQLMTKQTAVLDLHQLQQLQPAIFEVFRRQTSATPGIEFVTLPRYLCACFPHIHPAQIMYAIGFYSEYSLTAPLRKLSRDELLRADQRADIRKIFDCLDKTGSGVLPHSVLCSAHASAAEIHDTEVMLSRLHISDLTFDAFAAIVAPYVAEVRRKRRYR